MAAILSRSTPITVTGVVATACDVGRKAATYLDHAHHARHSPPRISPTNYRMSSSRRPRMFWQFGLERLAMWLPGHTYQCVSLPFPPCNLLPSSRHKDAMFNQRKLRNEPSTKMRAGISWFDHD